MRSRFCPLGFVPLALALALGCKEPPPPPPAEQPPPPPPPPTIKTVVLDPTQTVHHPAELGPQLERVEALDLALSAADRLGYTGEHDPATACAQLDFTVLRSAEKLETLRLSGCGDPISTGLGQLPLRELELADLELGAAAVEEVARLEPLRVLSLQRIVVPEGTPLRPLRSLALQTLEIIDIDEGSALAELLSYWPRTLEQVRLQGKWVDHNAVLALLDAKKLQKLTLAAPQLSSFSISKLDGLAQLHTLAVEGPGFNDASPFFLRDLPLRQLACENCPRFGDRGLENLRHFKDHLRSLALGSTAITPSGMRFLEPLTKLESLRLHGTDLTAESFAVLAKLPALTQLELSGELRDPKLTGLEQLQHLEVLRFTNAELDDRAASALGQLGALRELDLRGTKVSDETLAQLGKLEALRRLALSRTKVTSRGLAALTELSALESLDLGRTDIMDEGAEHLAKISSLRELRLDHTLVTDRAVEQLEALPNLQRLDLSHTVVSDASARALTRFPALVAVGLEGTRLRENTR